MNVTFVGCGDAFGTGGRFNTCIHVESDGLTFLVDCGASSMIALRAAGIEPNGIDAILITHLHGDHFAGLPFLLLDAQLYSRRRRPLTLAGPPGFSARLRRTQEVLFPGSSRVPPKFDLNKVELVQDEPAQVLGIDIMPFHAEHPSGAPSYSLRISHCGRTLVYTGDTEWTDALVDAADGADLLIAETLFYDKDVKFHLNYRTLVDNEDRLNARRIVLTHLGPEMMANLDRVDHEVASDGLRLSL